MAKKARVTGRFIGKRDPVVPIGIGDIARTAAFLASDAAFIASVIIPVTACCASFFKTAERIEKNITRQGVMFFCAVPCEGEQKA